MEQIDGALELTKGEAEALLHASRRLTHHLECAVAATDRETFALALLEADIHATVLAEEVEETRRLATSCGIELDSGVRAGGDDMEEIYGESEEDLEDEEDPLEDDEEEDDPEEGFDLPEEPEPEPMQLRRT